VNVGAVSNDGMNSQFCAKPDIAPRAVSSYAQCAAVITTE
jgi:hypothetical protein